MVELNIRKKCSINTNRDEDRFVGIKSEDGSISIHFPMGYRVSEDEIGLQKDIFNLLAVIGRNTNYKESEVLGAARDKDQVEFPIQSCIYIIKDFMDRGYFHENEVIYMTAKRGKINWGRTIKTQKAYVQDDDVFYLDFVVKKNSNKENELITLIHEFCVYESYKIIGWLFTPNMPAKPRIKENKALFVSTLKERIASTFNDRNKSLFVNMLSLIEHSGDLDAVKDYKYGTNRFEYVWERMIDRLFGIDGKDEYFPKTYWKINGKIYENACLEPDTIMLFGKDVYVLDAKYYKYGSEPKHIVAFLPESTSINKQITYGEFIATQDKFKITHGDNFRVFNAFIMPYASDSENEKMRNIGEAFSDWKSNDEYYQRVQGILLDVKTVMTLSMIQNDALINEMALCIESGI